jgi:hypothetical protein
MWRRCPRLRRAQVRQLSPFHVDASFAVREFLGATAEGGSGPSDSLKAIIRIGVRLTV